MHTRGSERLTSRTEVRTPEVGAKVVLQDTGTSFPFAAQDVSKAECEEHGLLCK